jgi:hypothetical protein
MKVEDAPAWAWNPSCHGRCVASGPDLGMDGPERAAALTCGGSVGDDVSGVAAMVVRSASMHGVLLQAHAGWS